jgi:uncharacterized membrane protein
MDSPPSTDGRVPFGLARIGPDDVRRRFLFGTAGTVASAIAVAYGLNFMLGPLNLGAIEFVGGALMTLGGGVGLLTSAVVLLPILAAGVARVARVARVAGGPGAGGVTERSPAARDGATDADGAEDPIAVVKRRYAAGEIGEEEFERRLDRIMDADRQGARDSKPDRERYGSDPRRDRDEDRLRDR